MNTIRVAVVGILALGIGLVGCGQGTTEAANEPAAVVEAIDGSELQRITLTARAVERLAIETASVKDGPGRSLSVPYGAVFYDANGEAWTYTNPSERVYVRAPITVEEIDGDAAILSEGPEPGTLVVIVGAPELYGSETGVGGGH